MKATPAASSAAWSALATGPPPTSTTLGTKGRPCSCASFSSSVTSAGTSVLWPSSSVETPTTCTSASIACTAAWRASLNSGPMSTSHPRSAKPEAATLWRASWVPWPSLATSRRGRRPARAVNLSTAVRLWATSSGAPRPAAVEQAGEKEAEKCVRRSAASRKAVKVSGPKSTNSTSSRSPPWSYTAVMAVRAASTSGKAKTPQLMAGKATVLRPFFAASSNEFL
mmetsp:Transcript_59585/g.158563  ORF Transcript_59585/g.158563 Transcript_59585/m.158563 type:complete len:225 (+) Transcript_59585:79-753(+)